MLILWVYFMVPVLIGANIPGFVTMLVTLVIYEAAFLSEVVRAGIMALGRGQMDAARALGHSYLGAMWYIILPQALYNMMPSILSQFVSTIKETTLGYVINVPELTFAANQINNQLLTKPFEVFFILATRVLPRLLDTVLCCDCSGAADCAQTRRDDERYSYPSNCSPKHLRPSHDHRSSARGRPTHDPLFERQQELRILSGAR